MKKGSLAAVMAVLAGLVVPAALQAQNGYFFKAPVVSVNLRAGASLPTASDPLHRFFMDELTLERRDFTTATVGADVAVFVSPRVDLIASFSTGRTDRHSEFRDWVDQDDLPIEQDTRLRRTPFMVGARVLGSERGRAAGRYAWVPTSGLLPYAGAGVGLMWYKLEQDGWFVDFDDLDIFPDFFAASGSTPLASVFGGVEWWPAPRFGFTLDGRFTYARAALRGDFADFDHIDLSGFQLSVGVSTRF